MKSRKILSTVAVLSIICVRSTVFAQEQRADPQAPKLIRKSGGVLQASAVRRVEPVYPPLAKAAQVSGSVVVEVTVDETGAVSEARALSGHPLLKDPAVAAARGWRFTPTKLEGVPVKVIGTITFNFELGDPKRLEELEAKVRQDPGSADAHSVLASEYSIRERNTEAIAEYLEVIRIKPDNVGAYFGLGWVYDRVGRIDEARDAFKKAIAFNGETTGTPLQKLQLTGRPWGAHILIAQFYYRHDEYREVIEVLRQAASIYPEEDEIHLFLGTAFLGLGDKFSALNEYNILKDKTTEDAKNLLERIEKRQ